MCKDPPYKVEESGYAGFILPIEVYFKNKVLFISLLWKPVIVNYDLYKQAYLICNLKLNQSRQLCTLGKCNILVTFHQEEPKKVRFDYDLFLHLEGHPPVNHLRCEKLTFNNPTEEFRRKLLKAGGVRTGWGWAWLTSGNEMGGSLLFEWSSHVTSVSELMYIFVEDCWENICI